MKQLERKSVLLTALVLLMTLPAWTPAAAQSAAPASSEAYGYFRTVEGRSLLSSREPEETRDVEVNLPVLSGDAVQVAGGSRLEVVLADGSVGRLEAGAEVVFDQLARSPDSPPGATTRLVLLTGEMQLHVPDAAADPEPIEIESSNTRVYLIRGGSYWLAVSPGDETVLVVRDGAAEVLTDEGSLLVHSGEEVRVSGTYQARATVARAGAERNIELWARDLEAAAYAASRGPVDQELSYAAAPLERAGSWVRVDGRSAWRPRVRYGWRPFTDGSWVYTPSGLTWVAQERWGWVTAHYGTWDYLPSYGWCWFPGRVYSPAWVYWYWGPSHAAWVPYGYYARHYGGYGGYGRWGGYGGFGLRFGVYGWASGGWSVFADWTFCPLGYFGRRGGRYYHRSGADLARDRRALAVPRGIITTDTRGLNRAVWTRPFEARRRLAELNHGRFTEGRSPGRDDLPDVTSFVARRRDLAPEVRNIVKPLAVSDRRSVLRQVSRSTGDLTSQSRSAVTGIPRKPAGALSERSEISRRETLVRGAVGGNDGSDRSRVGTRTVTRSIDSSSRFERPSVRRPTAFERAPTSVYSRQEPAGKLPSAREDAREGVRSSESRSRFSTGERPTEFERAPSSVYSRPSVSPRAPAGASERETPSRYSGTTRVFERRPEPESGDRAPSSVYSRPGYERPPISSGSSRGSVYDRGGSESGDVSRGSASPARPPAASSSSQAPARRVVESTRSHSSRSSSSSGSRASGSSGSSRRSSGASSSSGVQSRSSSVRSGSSSRSSARSKASGSSRSSSRSSAKKKDG